MFYLVALKANRIDTIRERMKDKFHLESRVSITWCCRCYSNEPFSIRSHWNVAQEANTSTSSVSQGNLTQNNLLYSLKMIHFNYHINLPTPALS